MMQYTQLVKRNVFIYLRNKGALFFSFLSTIIILCLMLFFLNDVNISALTDALAELGDRDAAADKENAALLIMRWTIGGIIPTNAVMVSISVYSSMVGDKNSKRADAMNVLPISKSLTALSYITASFVLSFVLCTATFMLSEAVCVIKGTQVLSLFSIFKIFLMIAVNSLSYSAIIYMLALFIKSESAWSGAGTVIGTLVGFLGGIYLPLGQLSQTLQTIIKCTPIIYSTSMFRQVMCNDLLNKIFFNVPDDVADVYKQTMGISVKWFSNNAELTVCLAILIGVGAICFVVGIIKLRKDNK